MTTSAPPAPTYRTYSHREILEIMTALLAALFTVMISTTIVSTALPTIMADLNGTQRQYTWVITASLLAMTVSTPVWGKLSDLYSKKVLAQVSLIMFVAGSVAAGMAHAVPLMMTARAVQGLAMGGVTALAQAIMGSIMSPRERGRYSGYMGAVMAVATVSGPMLGGLITDTLGWRWCFYVTIPLAVVAFILLQAKLTLPKLPDRKRSIDYGGAVLIAISSALPMLWVTFAGSDYDWISWQSFAFLAAFVVAATLLVIVELRVSEPMIPLRLLKNRTTVLMILAGISAGVAMFGSGVFLTQYFQLGTGATPLKAGIMTIPLIVAQMVAATVSGQIVSRTGRVKPVMLIGSVVLLGALIGLATLDHTTPYSLVALYMVLMGIGVGALVQNVVLAVQNTVDVTQIGAASAMIAFFRSLGGAVGVSILGAVLTERVATNIADGLRSLGAPAGAISGGSGETQLDITGLPAPVQTVFHHAYADAFGNVFLVAAIVAVVAVIAVLIMGEVPLRTTITLEKKEATAPGADASAAPATDVDADVSADKQTGGRASDAAPTPRTDASAEPVSVSAPSGSGSDGRPSA